MKLPSRFVRRLFVMAVCSLVLVVFGTTVTTAQDEVATVTDVANLQVAIDATWILVASILVFFMQAGFAFLESGMIRQTGVVNSLMENFMDACFSGIGFWAVGFGIAFGASQGGFFGLSNFFLSDAMVFTDGGVSYGEGISMFVLFFFQFAFAATAGTIITGAIAERTNFIGKIIYSFVVVMFIYPVVVHWVWSADGWLFNANFKDFAGSTVVHMLGGVLALIASIVVGPRIGRVFGAPPKPHNLGLATLGTLILWLAWYGFNAGSTLSMSNNGFVGLVMVNTTLGACGGAFASILMIYSRTGKWDLATGLNGSLVGLVGVTAGCAFVAPWACVIIGAISGVLMVLTGSLLERMKIDDAVGAFSVHGIGGAFGTLAIGLFGQPELGANGLLFGGGLEQLGIQAVGVGATIVWATVTGFAMFYAIKALGVLRIPAKAEETGIDFYEHGASLWPDVLPFVEEEIGVTGKPVTSPAVGD
ncbi:MAG: ammonium transporter [Anaerolineae bacterium]|nr:ammonium transporter [Anaerolineae bacterium]